MGHKQITGKWIALLVETGNKYVPFIMEAFSHLVWKG